MAVSRYAEWRPAAAPDRYVACLWVRETDGPRGHGQLIVPDGCVDLVWREERLELAGPDRGPRTVRTGGGETIAGVRLRPGAAGLLLGRVPVAEVCDRQVPLAEFHPDRADRLAERLARAGGPADAARVLDRFVSRLLPG
ncbi:DUF6597 domain-containing transcriptional factor [Peterkaempfera bronchialis]|uniref:DUF6597 domain-containing protein n=1 Tax=Peterkaempfera bronchialis TaxID=2126346 RepID=A0A345SUB4_9ACTN|nr:DUF6597 domain-containing transcriptional factor [Peterkaempfera bronchialis]AXI77319.1 hypothetical protein C7M71_007560 [Peterkaempfera bronchialis]